MFLVRGGMCVRKCKHVHSALHGDIHVDVVKRKLSPL